MMITLAMGLASCQKPYHQETERFVFVASNINLPYWKDAQAGFEDAGGVTSVDTGTAIIDGKNVQASKAAAAERGKTL